MGGIASGNLYSQEEYGALPIATRTKEQIVAITPQESQILSGMNRKERRNWMRANKRFSRSSKPA